MIGTISVAFGYALGLGAWVAFIGFQYRDRDLPDMRPVTLGWFACMMAYGLFEYGKGLLSLLG